MMTTIKPPPRLWLYFAGLALLTLMIGSYLFYRITQQVLSDSLLSAGEYYNVSMGNHLNTRYQSEITSFIESGETDATRLGRLFEASIENSPTVKIVLMANNRVLYSTDPADVGEDMTNDSDYVTALRTDQPISHLEDDGRVETYMPLYNEQGQPIGVFELYSNGVPLEAALRPIESDILEAALVLALFFLGTMGVLVWFADMRLRDQRRMLEHQNGILMLDLIARAELSHMIVQAMQEAFAQLDPAPPNSKQARAYKTIEQIAENLSLIVQIERGQMIPNKMAFGIDDLLRERASIFKEAEVAINQRSGIGVVADRAMLNHIIDALLLNLNEYNPHRSKILLSAMPDEREVKITASLGIANPTLQAGQINQTIELTVARMMAEKHSGKLIFEQDKGEGVKFHLLMPI